jgi:hypothetical protein
MISGYKSRSVQEKDAKAEEKRRPIVSRECTDILYIIAKQCPRSVSTPSNFS